MAANYEFLNDALNVVTGDRRRDYDHPLVNLLRIALRWSDFLGTKVTPENVVWMMVDVKISRQIRTPKNDNIVDSFGYLLCLNEIENAMIKLGYEKGYKTFNDMTVGEMHDLLVKISVEGVL